MAQACPLSYRTVDATVARMNALWTTLVVAVYLVTHQPCWLVLLGADFAMRLYGPKKLSPFYLASRGVQHFLKLPKHPTDAGAKRLAAHFGLLFSLMMLVGHFGGWTMTITVIGVIFATCAAMEFGFNYCVGCKIYHVWQAMKSGEV